MGAKNNKNNSQVSFKVIKTTKKQKMKRSIAICFILCTVFMSFTPKSEKTIGLSKCLKSKYALVPSGNVTIDGKQISTQEFYISKTEISNYEYNAFVQDVKAREDKELYLKVAPDTKKWESVANNKPLVTYYHNRAVYGEYPAVNMSYAGALEYCKWLTEKTNKELKGVKVEFRLPTREEWVRAAEGKLHQVEYAWGGPNVTNAKGCELCQFNRSAEPRALYENTSYTCSTKSYFPNSIGLYNMNGNVAEMTTEKGIAVGGSWASTELEVTNHSFTNYDSPSPMVGFRPVMVLTTLY